MKTNPLHAELLSGNLNMYLYFLPFSNTGMAHGLEIFPHERQELIYIVVHISVAADDIAMQEAIASAVNKIVSPTAF